MYRVSLSDMVAVGGGQLCGIDVKERRVLGTMVGDYIGARPQL